MYNYVCNFLLNTLHYNHCDYSNMDTIPTVRAIGDWATILVLDDQYIIYTACYYIAS